MTGISYQDPERSRLADAAALGGLLALCLIVGFLGSLATTPNIDPWYAGIAKPAWTPPPVVFPIVWTALYIMMAVAAWLVWRAPAFDARRRRGLFAFAVQLTLNAIWSWAFFGAQSPLFGLLIILPLLAAVARTTWLFRAVSRPAGLLMAPYLAWVAFATVLNATIFAMNA
ncbi:TspO/MBR family protein [Microbaculum sp. FT89]|uniref:TspO/MBR family protein n=1 Tax=Microbaculum sp. FT89 TaxID=3447298 RepID=UPI003F5385D8